MCPTLHVNHHMIIVSPTCTQPGMFYEVEMRRRVVVEPHELGGALQTQRAMFRRLLRDVEGDVGSEEHGFYVTVTTVERVSEGHIRAGTGAVAFSVDFKCIVFSLSVDEVVEAQVTQVLPLGFFAACGPQVVYVPRQEMTGFEFLAGLNEWRDSAGSVVLPNSMVRLRVVGRTWNPAKREFEEVGTLNGDLLGALIVEDHALDGDGGDRHP